MDLILGLAVSLHLGFEGTYNALHPHLRVQNENYIAGLYYNSERNVSPYVGYRFEQNRFGIEAGAVGGYSDAKVLPYVRATYNNLFMSPGHENGKVKGLVIGYEFNF